MIARMRRKCMALGAVGKINVPVLPRRRVAGFSPPPPAQANNVEDSPITAMLAQRFEDIVMHEGAGQHHLIRAGLIVGIERTGGKRIQLSRRQRLAASSRSAGRRLHCAARKSSLRDHQPSAHPAKRWRRWPAVGAEHAMTRASLRRHSRPDSRARVTDSCSAWR